MKDSDIEWIGLIPVEWETIKVKWSSWLKGRIGWQGLTASEYIDDGPFLVTGTDFQDGVVNWDSCAHISEERFEEDDDIHIKEGDLLITKDGTVGKVAIAKNCPEKVSLNSGVLLIRNVGQYRYYDKYLYYVLLSDEFWRWYTLSQTGQSTIKHLYQAQFYEFEYTYPSYTEQQRIANFLDAECARIDAIIEQTRATVEEYKKLKQSIITQAVTKGIRPNRPMKDSGIEWIGGMPNDWLLTKVKYVSSLVTDGAHVSPETENGVYDFVSTVNIDGNKIDFDNCLKTSIASYNYLVSTGCKPQIGDVLISKDGTVGKTVIVNEERDFVVASSLVIIRPKQEMISSEYLNYFLQSKTVQDTLLLLIHGAGLKRVSVAKNANLTLLLPDKEEQHEIVNYLNDKCKAIDLLIQKKEQFLLELDSLKKALIFEYVTGKKEAPL